MPRKTSKTSNTPHVTPRAVAARVVQEWFDELCDSADAFNGGTGPQTLDSNGFVEVQEAIKAENQKYGAVYTEAVQDEIDAREAGYLVGIQVGLRLRAAGGAKC